jgi:TRAP-type uncharacterized transport system fused permease subunit
VSAGRTIAVLAVAVTAAGLIMAALTNTGLLLAFSGIIRQIAGDSLALMTLLVALTCLFLGMGVPTTPAYIITAAIGAPLIAEHSTAPLLAVHLFVFYFAVLADATPPVAAASYAAAAIGKANPMATGAHAFRLAAGGFICGIAFIYEPALMLHGTLAEILAVTTAIASGLVLIAAGQTGFVTRAVPALARLPLIGAGIFCALYHDIDILLRAPLGVALVAALLLWSRSGEAASRPAPGFAHDSSPTRKE